VAPEAVELRSGFRVGVARAAVRRADGRLSPRHRRGGARGIVALAALRSLSLRRLEPPLGVKAEVPFHHSGSGRLGPAIQG